MKKYILFFALMLSLGFVYSQAVYATPGITVDFTVMQERLENGVVSRERSSRLELRNMNAREGGAPRRRRGYRKIQKRIPFPEDTSFTRRNT